MRKVTVGNSFQIQLARDLRSGRSRGSCIQMGLQLISSSIKSGIYDKNIKKQLSRIKSDADAHLTDEEIEVILTRILTDKADLNKLLAKSWCDQHSDIVLDMVRKYSRSTWEMGNQRHNKFDDENSQSNYHDTSFGNSVIFPCSDLQLIN
ncbi:hypothetical protein AAHA92_05922 [Salvia divinorum]|uniref:Uncharacterized protein n=1 Tax=Salvia divinorum TaxID=28513 RepID=A0ABD1I694_SALDI